MKCVRCNEEFAGNELFKNTKYYDICSECLTDDEKTEMLEILQFKQEHSLDTVLTFSEAQKKWGLGKSTLREAARNDRFQEGETRKSGGTWLVTQSAMERLYGDKEEKEMKKVAKESLKEVQDFLELGYTPVEAWVEDFEEGPHGIESLKIEWSDGNQIHSTEANQNLDEPVQCWLYQL